MNPKGNSGGTSSLGSTWPADRAEPRNGRPQVLAGFFSAKNETAAKAKGVKRLCIPNRAIKSPERKREQKKRWFRTGQKWRTGCEGSHQRGQATERPQSQPIQGRCRNPALGRPRGTFGPICARIPLVFDEIRPRPRILLILAVTTFRGCDIGCDGRL